MIEMIEIICLIIVIDFSYYRLRKHLRNSIGLKLSINSMQNSLSNLSMAKMSLTKRAMKISCSHEDFIKQRSEEDNGTRQN